MAVFKPKAVDWKQYDLQSFIDAWMRYIELSKYLFAAKEPIYDINEMPPSNKFFKFANDITAMLGIDWRTMTHEDGNRIMLALL